MSYQHSPFLFPSSHPPRLDDFYMFHFIPEFSQVLIDIEPSVLEHAASFPGTA